MWLIAVRERMLEFYSDINCSTHQHALAMEEIQIICQMVQELLSILLYGTQNSLYVFLLSLSLSLSVREYTRGLARGELCKLDIFTMSEFLSAIGWSSLYFQVPTFLQNTLPDDLTLSAVCFPSSREAAPNYS